MSSEQVSLLLSVTEAARTLAISRTTLDELMCRGELEPISIGRCVRFARADLIAFVDARREQS